jgi:hypothetical protein
MHAETLPADAKHGIHPQLVSLAVDVNTLTPDPANARLHDERNLKSIVDSYRAHGQRKPIVVQVDTQGRLVVRAGNGQLAAARALGWTHVAAVFVSENDADATAYALRDNRTAELAEWDLEVLGESLRFLSDQGIAPLEVGWAAYEAEPFMAAQWEPGAITGEGFQVPDKRVSLMFTREEWDRLKAHLGAKPTADEVLKRLGVPSPPVAPES